MMSFPFYGNDMSSWQMLFHSNHMLNGYIINILSLHIGCWQLPEVIAIPYLTWHFAKIARDTQMLQLVQIGIH